MRKYTYKVVVISELCIYETENKDDAMEMLKAYKEIDKDAKMEIRVYNQEHPTGYIKIM